MSWRVCVIDGHGTHQRIDDRQRGPLWNLLVQLSSLFHIRARLSPRRHAPPVSLHQARSPHKKLRRNPATRSRPPQGLHRNQSRRKGLVCQRTKSVPLPLLVSSFISSLAWLSWLNAAILIGTFAVALFNASHDPVARAFAYVYAALSVGVLVRSSVPPIHIYLTTLEIYGFYLYQSRITMIRKRDPGHYGSFSSTLPALALSPSQTLSLVRSSSAPSFSSQFWPTLSSVVCTTLVTLSHADHRPDHPVHEL